MKLFACGDNAKHGHVVATIISDTRSNRRIFIPFLLIATRWPGQRRLSRGCDLVKDGDCKQMNAAGEVRNGPKAGMIVRICDGHLSRRKRTFGLAVKGFARGQRQQTTVVEVPTNNRG